MENKEMTNESEPVAPDGSLPLTTSELEKTIETAKSGNVKAMRDLTAHFGNPTSSDDLVTSAAYDSMLYWTVQLAKLGDCRDIDEVVFHRNIVPLKIDKLIGREDLDALVKKYGCSKTLNH
jgi:hypothetical protein